MSDNRTTTISEKVFDQRFEDGDNLDAYLDWDHSSRPNLATRRININFPTWMVKALDAEAKRLSVHRQAVIKMWISDRLKSEREANNR